MALEDLTYAELNRGRYLCEDHGGFCDESDNYANTCALCKSKRSRKKWRTNEVARTLVIVNDLQRKTQIILTMYAVFFAAVLSSNFTGIEGLRLAERAFQDYATLCADGFEVCKKAALSAVISVSAVFLILLGLGVFLLTLSNVSVVHLEEDKSTFRYKFIRNSNWLPPVLAVIAITAAYFGIFAIAIGAYILILAIFLTVIVLNFYEVYFAKRTFRSSGYDAARKNCMKTLFLLEVGVRAGNALVWFGFACLIYGELN